MRIILASTSPRRKELIKKLSIEVDIVSPCCDENISGLFGADYAMSIARRKAESVIGGIVVGADTVVIIGNEILGKPRSDEDAEVMFRKLCGATHSVITGLCVKTQKRSMVSSCTSSVTFKPYDANIVREYIKSGKSRDKAGAYGIQDEEIMRLTEKIDGEIDNIIGLPVKLLDKMLKTVTNEKT